MGKIYSLWPLELKPGVTGEDVEQFAREFKGKLLGFIVHPSSASSPAPQPA